MTHDARGPADGVAPTVIVGPPEEEPRTLTPGESLVFGRGSHTDVTIDGDPSLSRVAGRITATDSGAVIDNLSAKRALRIEVGTEHLWLPPTPTGGLGLVLTTGAARVGTATMLDRGRAIRVRLVGPTPRAPDVTHEPGGATTGAAVQLNVMTKEFMVAFLLCRPWLVDSSRRAPLPESPAIGRQALDLTGSHHLLRSYDTGPVRDRITQQVNDHLKQLRGKLRHADLVPAHSRLSLAAVASALLHFDIVTRRHLTLPDDPVWLTAQESRWWSS
ncbi:hypothetical protein LO762_29720 [Actinocorallia sp. API 0066]|uniref:hypothetical protein n=1 Tax=Actinocorallia sp. API 0066 TaxID=2896846 RepID=UPI001E431EC2|nr:hypothetical protein [Actinocorallia sp. API 0066]MCD0453329.1 hypothetical protein [Actinocorallia sp. API 0066]